MTAVQLCACVLSTYYVANETSTSTMLGRAACCYSAVHSTGPLPLRRLSRCAGDSRTAVRRGSGEDEATWRWRDDRRRVERVQMVGVSVCDQADVCSQITAAATTSRR
jgi:hypothetical protein